MSNKRVQRRREQMFPLIEKYLSSGKPQLAFCLDHDDLPLAVLNYWLRKYRLEQEASEDTPAAWVEVKPSREEPSPVAPVLELIYPNGIRLRLFSALEPDYLHCLIQFS
jgi:hypothetical protein